MQRTPVHTQQHHTQQHCCNKCSFYSTCSSLKVPVCINTWGSLVFKDELLTAYFCLSRCVYAFSRQGRKTMWLSVYSKNTLEFFCFKMTLCQQHIVFQWGVDSFAPGCIHSLQNSHVMLFCTHSLSYHCASCILRFISRQWQTLKNLFFFVDKFTKNNALTQSLHSIAAKKKLNLGISCLL